MADANFQVKKGLTVPKGSESEPSIIFTAADSDTGIYSPAEDQVSVATAGSEVVRVNSSGQIQAVGSGSAAVPIYTFAEDNDTGLFSPGNNKVALATDGNEVLLVDNKNVSINGSGLFFDASGNRLGINTTSPGALLHVEGGSAIVRSEYIASGTTNSYLYLSNRNGGNWRNAYVGTTDESEIVFGNNGVGNDPTSAGTEKVRIDNSGRLLVGTDSNVPVPLSSSTLGDPGKQLASTNQEGATSANYVYSTVPTVAPNVVLARSRGSLNTQGLVSADDSLGRVVFEGSDGQAVGTNAGFIRAAVIEAEVDGTAASGDMPGRLVFSTTPSGSASPTERMWLDSEGRMSLGSNTPYSSFNVIGGNSLFRSDYSAAGTTSSLIYLSNRSGGNWRNAYIGTTDLGEFIFSNGGTGADPTSAGTEKIRIDGVGRLLVGTVASPAYQLELATDSAGKPSTNTWTIVSDERIKEDIQLADLDICYDAIKSIPLKRFKWKDEVYTEQQVPDRHKLGWIAQDVEVIFPKAVRVHEFKYNQIFEETVIPAIEEKLDEYGNVIESAIPERIEKGKLISEEIIKDCRDLNADQIYAAMYGALQKLIQKVELLETEVNELKNK